jgi:hypothetical protein
MTMRYVIACAVAAAFSALTAAMAAEPNGLDEGMGRDGTTTSGTCNPTQLKFKTSSASANTTSSIFSEVPNTKIAFTQGGSAISCVIVHYSAMASAQDPHWIQMRVVMDGRVIAEPGDVQFDGYTEISRVRAFSFIFPEVGPGSHNVVVLWRSYNTGYAFMHRRTTIVQHK